MISDVLIGVGPNDSRPFHQECPRHHPDIADRLAGAMAFQGGAEAAGYHRRRQRLPQPALRQAEGAVEILIFVGDCPSPLPETVEKIAPFLRRALVEKQHRRVGGILPRDLFQIVNRLPAKDSTKVAQEYQQGRPAADLVSQRLPGQINPFDRDFEKVFANFVHGDPFDSMSLVASLQGARGMVHGAVG